MHSTEALAVGIAALGTASLPAVGAVVMAVEESGVSTSSVAIIIGALTGVTVPLLRWVLGRLDKSLEAQQKFNAAQEKFDKLQAENSANTIKILGVLVTEQREKRRENAQHHEETMGAIEEIRTMLEKADEVEQRIVPPEAPKEH